MGFGGLLQFAVKYFVGVLAWPVIALGYPLCASIKAIETDSVSDTQKLNTYWVVLSLILLLEHAFANLLEWLVLWPYIRIMIVCWLVIPYFDGAFYIYKHLIRPCLSVEPQIVINWFNERKESSYVKDDILTEIERYVKENGPEALEKILASKYGSRKPNLDVQGIESVSSTENKVVEKSVSTGPNHDLQEIELVSSIENKVVEKLNSGRPNVTQKNIKPAEVLEKKEVRAAEQLNSGSPNVTQKNIKPVEVLEKKEVRAAEQLNSGSPNVTQKTIKPVEVLEKKEVRAAEQVSRVEPNLPQVEKKNFAAPEIKMMIPEVVVAAHGELPKTPAPPDLEVQKWTCEICQVTTTCENNLKSHYNGKKHKAKIHSEPKTTSSNGIKQKVNVKLEENVYGHEPKKPNKVEVQGQPQSIHASAVRKSETKVEPAKKVATSSGGTKQKVNVKLEDKVLGHQPKKPNKGSNLGVKSSSLWCSVCNVSCTSEIDMASHLGGRKHLCLISGGTWI
ncbi:hypothetical protein FNV43_RR22973 [Rhamnella rubrinervis]|uniref:HVA22-like protein n=1 Tax=Rhamnella rubrinervis TaxID=2594499 RepID=A0A8K0GSI7_9ROSA|nr:hypothetical protein FNV43_RR22973 [Rhamnella rubrinervis]